MNGSSRKAVLMGMVAVLAGLSLPVALSQNGTAKKIGIYDSRAVVIAYLGSDRFNKEMQAVRAEHRKAKESGDTATVKRIDDQMSKLQKLRHMQGFSTAPIDDVLTHIQYRLPVIAKEAGVEAVVSKWDEAAIAKYPGAERVDVTDRLVDEFTTNAKQRKSALEIQKHTPLSLKDAENIDD